MSVCTCLCVCVRVSIRSCLHVRICASTRVLKRVGKKRVNKKKKDWHSRIHTLVFTYTCTYMCTNVCFACVCGYILVREFDDLSTLQKCAAEMLGYTHTLWDKGKHPVSIPTVPASYSIEWISVKGVLLFF